MTVPCFVPRLPSDLLDDIGDAAVMDYGYSRDRVDEWLSSPGVQTAADALIEALRGSFRLAGEPEDDPEEDS